MLPLLDISLHIVQEEIIIQIVLLSGAHPVKNLMRPLLSSVPRGIFSALNKSTAIHYALPSVDFMLPTMSSGRTQVSNSTSVR